MHQKLVVVPLSGSHNRKDFDCGTLDLNKFLAEQASQSEKKGLARTFVAQREIEEYRQENSPKAESIPILGYYSLSSHRVMQEESGLLLPRKFPKNVPVVCLSRLAVDISVQGQRLGENLLMNAIHRTYEIGQNMGVAALWVDAKDENAAQFYSRYGFQQIQPRQCFLPYEQISQLVQ